MAIAHTPASYHLISPHRLLALLPWVLLWRWDLLTAHSSIGHFSLSHDADFENCCRYWSLVDKWMVVLNMHHVLDLCYHMRHISSTVSGCAWIVFAVAPRKLATQLNYEAHKSRSCACGHLTESVQHVVVHCVIHNTRPLQDGSAGFPKSMKMHTLLFQ